MITNMNNQNSINVGKIDDTLVRIWADRASSNDVIDNPQNIEWSPYIKFEVVHDFDLTSQPVDLQQIDIRIDSWMSLPSHGGVKIVKFKEANTQTESDVD